MAKYQIDMPDETVIEIFNGLPAITQAKLKTLMASGMDSTEAFDSLTDEEQQIIEDAVKGV